MITETRPPGEARAALLIAGIALREALRRRVFVVVGLLSVVFLVLYALAVWQAFKTVDHLGGGFGIDPRVVVGASLAGLGMFATLFLGTILAVFLTLGAVRDEGDSGLLAPLLVRPLRRRTLLAGRWLGATAVCAPYVIVLSLAAFVITDLFGDWWPDRTLVPLLGLAFSVAILAALSLAASISLSSTANGIAVFMLFGAGLAAGLLGQVGEAIASDSLERVARIAAWALPFEGLYQSGLAQLTADTGGLNAYAIDLGPFGGAQGAGPGLWLFALAYLVAIGAVATYALSRRDF